MVESTVGQYRILSELGAGGMGIVYLAEDPRLQRRVAIKFLSPETNRVAAARQRFLQEARAASALDHRNVCAIYQVDETPDGRVYMVMGYYEGETLDRTVARGPLPAGRAVALVAQLADGLAAAHASGIVHRDLKPSNLLVTREGVLKILDFGLARVQHADSLTRTGASLGTPLYMAPEQIRDSKVDHRADLWSAGVVLFELLTAQRPFAAGSPAATLYAIANDDPPRLATTGSARLAGLQRILDRCLQKDPARRYAEASALAADLRSEEPRFRDFEEGGTQSVVIARPRRARSSAGRWLVPTAGIVVGTLLVWAASAWVAAHPRAALRVVVPAVAVNDMGAGDSTEASLASSSAQNALLRELALRRGLSAVDGAGLKGVEPTPGAISRALAADEALVATLTTLPDEWKVSVRRIAARDSSVRWAESFSVPRNQLLALDDALAAHVARGYPRNSPRSSAARPSIDPATYARFAELDRGFRVSFLAGSPPQQVIEQIEALRRAAPRFIEAPLLEARFALYQFESASDAEMLGIGRKAADDARAMAPEDPRPLTLQFSAAALRHDAPAARALLAQLSVMNPGDDGNDFFRARVMELDGNVAGAIETMRALVRRRPARIYYERLIRMEYQDGRYADARSHLELLMSRYPQYTFPRSYLAQLELLYGRPARAESLYADLAAEYPKVVYLSNLSLARMLEGKYDDAIRDLERALTLSPDNTSVLLNLADCLQLSGRNDDARNTYARVIDRAGHSPAADSYSNLLIRAQSLAHLGRAAEAIAATQQAMRTGAEDPDALFQASLVYALVGEKASALVNAKRAIEKGMQPRWFHLPWFDALRADAEFTRILEPPSTVAVR